MPTVFRMDGIRDQLWMKMASSPRREALVVAVGQEEGSVEVMSNEEVSVVEIGEVSVTTVEVVSLTDDCSDFTPGS